MNNTTTIAIFGDLHGRVLLALSLIDRWQQEHNSEIHMALCVGDVGVYRSFRNMGKISQRFAKKDPAELGFSKYFYSFGIRSGKLQRHPAVDAILERISANLYFVPGNHEEHAYLAEITDQYAMDLSLPIAVDYDWCGVAAGRYQPGEFAGYRQIWMLPQGPRIVLDGPLDESTWEPSRQITLRAINALDKYTPQDAWSGSAISACDLVISHETYLGRLKGFDASGRRDAWGSERLKEFLQRSSPHYHFFGHHHWYYPPVSLSSHTGRSITSIGLNQMIFANRSSPVSQHCFGILRLSEATRSFELVEDDWLVSLRYEDCRDVL